MHPNPNQRLFFVIQAALLSLCFPCFFCQDDSRIYAECIQPFQCGRLTNISYPFWGGTRPLYCGRPGFEFNCDDDVPLLNISSLSYRVLEFNFSTFTLRVARQDIWNNTCPDVLYNTTFEDTEMFEIGKDSRDRNVTLYYNCTNKLGGLPNQFNCDVDEVTTVNVFNAGDGSYTTVCTDNIYVPVSQSAAQALENPTSSSMNVLQEALASGFSIRWIANNDNCQNCRQNSNGTCFYTATTRVSGCSRDDSMVNIGPPTAEPPVPPASSPPASLPTASDLSAPQSSRREWIILGVILGTIGIVIFTIVQIFYLKRRRWPGSPNQGSNQDIEKYLLQQGSLTSKRYTYSEIKKITKSFSEKLGQGGYGTVYKGKLPDDCLVAVKVLTETNTNGEDFVNELVSISRTSHVNIVNLLGFCYDRNKRALIYEFMPNKSLDEFISDSGSPNSGFHLDLNKLYNIAVGVGKGLEYLHTECKIRIVHFDIKPQNILLDEDFCPKISDFGLAKLCKKKQSALSLLGARGTIGYIAPEMVSRNYGRVSHKSDVYSYGMMVLEMAGANKIVKTESAQSSENYFPDKIYELVTSDVARKLDDFIVEEEQDLARKMFLVGFWCIQTAPSDRPSMSKVVEMLEGSLQSIQIPPKPVLFAPTLPGHEFSPSLSAYTETENSIEVLHS